MDRSWEYINHSQTHECGNWDWVGTTPFLGIHKWDYRCSVRLIAGTWYINWRSFLVGLGPSWGLGGFIIVLNSLKTIIISQTTEKFQSVKVRQSRKHVSQSKKDSQGNMSSQSKKHLFILSRQKMKGRHWRKLICHSQKSMSVNHGNILVDQSSKIVSQTLRYIVKPS